MTTKRKQILKAMAFASCTTMDDLALSTGLERKNLHDNVKASIREDLCERIRDDVTGLPAYKLTTKGRAWLENDKDNSSSVKPQPAVGENSGSQDKGSRVAGGAMCADPLPLGKADPAPPKPDDLPVAAGADVNALINSINEFCGWLGLKANVRYPINLHGCKSVVSDLMQAVEVNIDLQATVLEQAMKIKSLQADIDDLILDQLDKQPTRYIVTDTYLLADSEAQACEIALELGKEAPINTPVIVFHSHKARELRINWRDA